MTSVTPTIQERVALPSASDGGGGISVSAGDVLGMLRRRLVLLITLLFLFSGLAGGGFALWWFVFPGYRSECLIECISNIPATELSFEHDRLRREEHDAFVLTQALFLKSPVILGDTLQLTAVRETQWYGLIAEGEHLIELTKDVSAAPVRGTNFLRVAMSCRNDSDGQVIVAAVVKQWYETVRRRSAEDFTSQSLRASREEQDALDGNIRDKRERLARIAERIDPGARTNPANNAVQEQVRQYTRQVATLRLELNQLQEYQAIYSDPQGPPVTADDRAIVEQDPEVAQLSQHLFLLEQQRVAELSKFGDAHTIIKQYGAQITAIEKALAERRSDRLREVRDEKIELANTAVAATRQALFLAQEDLAKSEATLQDQDRLLLEYATLDEEIGRNTEYLVELDTFINKLTRVVRQQSAVNVNIAQPATEPLERNTPTLILLPLGFILAAGMAVGLTLLVEFMDKSVRTSQDITRHLDIALLGAVPDVDDEEVRIDKVETAVRDVPRSMVAEAFRRIRANLQFSAPAERQRCLVVTSPQPSDGKTSVASNLAIALAQGGRRVLLVDANFRRPRLAEVFGKSKTPGLSNLLIGEGSLTSYVVKTDLASLDLLPAGPVPPNPAELLDSEQCRAFLQEAATRYDQVLLDTAPVLLASDALCLAGAVDGVILVVRANRNTRGLAKRACSLLAGANARVFGAVLNAARVTRGGYFREQLRNFYDYQAEVEVASPQRPLIDSDQDDRKHA